ncbi:MAG: hypothetical protein JSR98_02925 [Proteobacteria bacterium]|nr:hypothetical protein [Pseudomonadota bacterium]
MKIAIITAVAATALIGGAAFAQQPSTPASAPPAASTGTATSTSVTTTDPATGATATVTTLTNGPVPDTPANRAKYGQPMSNAGKRTPAKGN